MLYRTQIKATNSAHLPKIGKRLTHPSITNVLPLLREKMSCCPAPQISANFNILDCLSPFKNEWIFVQTFLVKESWPLLPLKYLKQLLFIKEVWINSDFKLCPASFYLHGLSAITLIKWVGRGRIDWCTHQTFPRSSFLSFHSFWLCGRPILWTIFWINLSNSGLYFEWEPSLRRHCFQQSWPNWGTCFCWICQERRLRAKRRIVFVLRPKGRRSLNELERHSILLLRRNRKVWIYRPRPSITSLAFSMNHEQPLRCH